MKKIIVRVMENDYENDTIRVIYEIEAKDIVSISARSDCDYASISIVTKSGDIKCFTEDYYTGYNIEFCQV